MQFFFVINNDALRGLQRGCVNAGDVGDEGLDADLLHAVIRAHACTCAPRGSGIFRIWIKPDVHAESFAEADKRLESRRVAPQRKKRPATEWKRHIKPRSTRCPGTRQRRTLC